MADRQLDARQLKCPFPILKSKRALGEVPVGGTLEVLATDPGSPDDFVAFCESTGNTLLESTTLEDGAFRFIILRVR
jgi:tRNA 2-thiouridine synthesizing protein A